MNRKSDIFSTQCIVGALVVLGVIGWVYKIPI